MAFTTANLQLVGWDLDGDGYDHGELYANWNKIDDHYHDPAVFGGQRIPTTGLADSAVTTAKLADNSVTSAKIVNATIVEEDIANGAVTKVKLGADVTFVPLGAVIPWYRPSLLFDIPDDYVVCDGATVLEVNHDWVGAGTITTPDLRNKFVLGAATSGTGVGTATPPAENATGGSHTEDLTHTHTAAHTHPIAGHAHTVNDHTHTVGAHTHPVDSHTHPISADGTHTHAFSGNGATGGLHTRRNVPATSGSGTAYDFVRDNGGGPDVYQEFDKQSLYVAGVNAAAGGGSYDEAVTTDSPATHNHGGSATATAPTAQANAPLASGGATPGTNSPALTTESTAPTVSSSLAVQDIRPAFVGLLYLLKVRT